MKNNFNKGSKEWHKYWDPIIEKRRKTCIEKYGYFTTFQTKEGQEKAKQGVLHKYGVDNVRKSDEIKEKIHQTKLRKYGKNNISNQIKAKETCLEKYGETNVSKVSSIKKKKIITTQKHYKVNNPFQAPEIKEKIKLTNMERYGVSHPAQSAVIQEKQRQRNKEKYGYEFTSQVPEIREKMQDTLNINGGIGNARKDTFNKMKKTSLEKYGFEFPTQCDTIKNAIKETCYKKYGVFWHCLTKECKLKGNNSKPNQEFERLIQQVGLDYEREFHLEDKSYDFKISDYLIEINPWWTHNSSISNQWNEPKDITYHYKKSQLAAKYGFKCIHIFDWMDKLTILEHIKSKKLSLSSFRDIIYYAYNPRTHTLRESNELNVGEVLICDGGQDILIL